MEPENQRRRDTLVDLIELRVPLSEGVAAVRRLRWDSDNDLVFLSSANVVTALRKYLHGDLSAVDLESWANALESREDIGVEPGKEESLRAFVFETANPALAAPISDDYAHRWLKRLEGSSEG